MYKVPSTCEICGTSLSEENIIPDNILTSHIMESHIMSLMPSTDVATDMEVNVDVKTMISTSNTHSYGCFNGNLPKDIENMVMDYLTMPEIITLLSQINSTTRNAVKKYIPKRKYLELEASNKLSTVYHYLNYFYNNGSRRLRSLKIYFKEQPESYLDEKTTWIDANNFFPKPPYSLSLFMYFFACYSPLRQLMMQNNQLGILEIENLPSVPPHVFPTINNNGYTPFSQLSQPLQSLPSLYYQGDEASSLFMSGPHFSFLDIIMPNLKVLKTDGSMFVFAYLTIAAPNLRILMLNLYDADPEMPVIFLDQPTYEEYSDKFFQYLQHLVVDSFAFSDIFYILALAPQLQCLEISFMLNTNLTLDDILPPISQHNNIQYLVFHYYGSLETVEELSTYIDNLCNAIIKLQQHINLPALQSIEIKFDSQYFYSEEFNKKFIEYQQAFTADPLLAKIKFIPTDAPAPNTYEKYCRLRDQVLA